MLLFGLLLAGLTLTSCDKKTEGGGYPLTNCVVSGEALGSMGDPVVLTHEGREVRLCCDSCIPKFNADPAKYLEKLK
ncbi:MAG: hypothetical protein KDN18_24860 [Verrucomicrobiae bacterium]|nr:hypothetical protein [Verrucomicrobiae bacterium]